MSKDEQDAIVKAVMQLKPRMYPYLLGILGNAEDAEDAFQDTVIVVMHKWQAYETDTNLKAWAFEIGRRTALKRLRTRGRQVNGLSQETMDLMQAELTTATSFDEGLHRREALKICLQRLHENTRELLALRYREHLACEVIAEKLKRPLNSVYVSLSKARKQLRICITSRPDVVILRLAGHGRSAEAENLKIDDWIL